LPDVLILTLAVWLRLARDVNLCHPIPANQKRKAQSDEEEEKSGDRSNADDPG
jgi:hypothetical protein